jgi:O-glycosyl hydrolase
MPILFMSAIVLIAAALISTADRSVTKMEESTESIPTLEVDFAQLLQSWDGFGVNYVQLAQSIDPANDPQDYGGLGRLNAESRDAVLDMIFGTDGLQPNIVKMFLDPFHQVAPEEPYDHESTTRWMRYFAAEGVRRSKLRHGEPLEVIATLYGPPPWATKQKILRGRDLDPAEFENLARYMIS